MPSNRFRLIRLGSELTTNFVGVQPVGSLDIILVGFEPESVQFRFVELGSELTTNLSEVQSVGSPDIILVSVEPESVRFRILVLLNLLGVTPVT